MRSTDNQDFEMARKPEDFRLETPRMAGYRAGMTSSSVIGRKLGRMYSLPSDVPREIGDLIQAIDRKIIQEG